MSKHHLLIPLCYLAFAWQAALRPDIAWHGYSPNFLVLALIAALWCLSDATALVAVAVLGLLSDSLAERHLGNDMLCFLAVAGLIQIVCPPRLLRHSALLLVLVLLATILIDFTTVAVRSTLSRDLATSDNATSMIYVRWGLMALGNGFYTALLAAVPLMAIHLWNGRALHSDSQAVGNHWHRLTS